MSVLKVLATDGATGGGATYVEDVFSAYTYTGNGSTQTITNGIDLAGKGGLVWVKTRSAGSLAHSLNDTARGAGYSLSTNNTLAQSSFYNDELTAFNSTGFSLGADGNQGIMNLSAATYVSWSFAQANKFFTQAQATVSGGVTATVNLSSLGTVGMVAVKRTDSTSAWFVFHRSCTSGKLVYLNTTAAETTDGSVTLSGTTLSLVGGTIANGTYIVYAWAHDTTSTGLIQCGTCTTDVSGYATVTTGWEPQYVLSHCIDVTDDWYIGDTMRGAGADSSFPFKTLYANTSGSENNGGTPRINATGFTLSGNSSKRYIYLAIRRGPMKLPTSGTQVYNAIARTGNGTAYTETGVGFPLDLFVSHQRNSANDCLWEDRLRGATKDLYSNLTQAEGTLASAVTGFDAMDGVKIGTDGAGLVNGAAGGTYIHWNLRRYPGVFDVVCYTGTGSVLNVSHNLGVVPELMITKRRTVSTGDWHTYNVTNGNGYAFYLNLTNAPDASASYWNNTTPTASVFTVGTGVGVNANGSAYVAYLFATLAGISKVGSYSGTNGTQTINCGFTTGARFIMIKRTDSTGDWFVYDTTREGGSFPAGNDKHLSLNTTAAEIATTDDIDADTSGFIVNQNATTNLSATSATYIYLAFA